MHRRVAHTAAVVVPHTYSAERLARVSDPARVVPDNTNYYGTQDVYIPRQDSSDLSGYDLTHNDDNEQHHWRRLDSRGESILSGLDSPGQEELDRFRGSPESMRRGGSLIRVAEEDADPPSPTDPIDPQLEPEDAEEVIEWELEQNGLYGGEPWPYPCLAFSLTPSLSFRIIQTTFGTVHVRATVSVDHLCCPRGTTSSRMASPEFSISLSPVLPLAPTRGSLVIGCVCPNAPAARSPLHRLVASTSPQHRLASNHLLTRVTRKSLAPRFPCTAACPSRLG